MMSRKFFPTPQDAAMSGFPATHCRVLAMELDGTDGYVLLDTGPREYIYLYGGTVERFDEGWCSGCDSNGGGVGWTRTDDQTNLGVVAVSGEAPSLCTAVRVEWRGERREVLVQSGVYLVTWWREPLPGGDWPRVTAFRINDDWQPARENRQP